MRPPDPAVTLMATPPWCVVLVKGIRQVTDPLMFAFVLTIWRAFAMSVL